MNYIEPSDRPLAPVTDRDAEIDLPKQRVNKRRRPGGRLLGLGAVIGLLGGPVGVVAGALIGAGVGAGTGAAVSPGHLNFGSPPWSDR